MKNIPDFLASKLQQFKYTSESQGLRRAVLETVSSRGSYVPHSDLAFDRAHGTDTAGQLQPSELGIANAERTEQAILYLPSPASVTDWMLRNSGLDPAEYAFVDFGCGKGRVAMLASSLPYKRVVGVEISPTLAPIARNNVQAYQSKSRAGSVSIHHGDATDFEFPLENLHLHFYHPFSPEITSLVLDRLAASLAQHPRRVFIAYLLYTAAVEPVKQAFAAFPSLGLKRYEQSLRGQYNWLFYANH